MTDSFERAARLLATACVIALVGACASQPPTAAAPSPKKGAIVLLPEKDGQATSLIVYQGEKRVLLDKPYAAATVRTDGIDPYQSSQREVDRQFGAAIAAQPARPTTFVLYFVENKDEFTDDSKKLVEQLLADIARRPVPDVLVVGHTDAVGSDQVNDALGQRRADAVRTALITRGIPAADIRAVSRGKRALAVPTPDGVAEPRNRRVEIVIR